MKKRKITEVLVTTAEKKQIRDFFHVSHGTVNAALKGITRSYLADQIREMAISLGGVKREKELDENNQTENK